MRTHAQLLPAAAARAAAAAARGGVLLAGRPVAGGSAASARACAGGERACLTGQVPMQMHAGTQVQVRGPPPVPLLLQLLLSSSGAHWRGPPGLPRTPRHACCGGGLYYSVESQRQRRHCMLLATLWAPPLLACCPRAGHRGCCRAAACRPVIRMMGGCPVKDGQHRDATLFEPPRKSCARGCGLGRSCCCCGVVRCVGGVGRA